MVPSSPLVWTVTPSNDVSASATPCSAREPLSVVCVVRVVVVADAGVAPTTPATNVATPMHAAANPPRTL
jgi:hypothetical protein